MTATGIVSGARRAIAIALAWMGTGLAAAGAAGQTTADSAWAAGDVTLAERLYASELEEGSASPRALHRLALIYAWSERYDRSIALFDELAAGDGNNVEAAVDRARVLAWRNDLEGSEAAYRAILAADPARREARLGLAQTLSWRGELAAAEAIYAELLAADPRDPDALAGHARMAAWNDELDEAERRWRAALALHPDDPTLLIGLGTTLRWSGRTEAAIRTLGRAVELAPGNEAARRELRLARLARTPRLGPSFAFESDSDGNRIATLGQEVSLWPAPWGSLAAGGYLRRARTEGTGAAGTAYGALLELRLRPPGGWEVDLGAGASHASLDAGSVRPRWQLRAATPGHRAAQLWIRGGRRAIDATPALMRAGVEVTELAAGARGRLAGVRADLSASIASFRGSEDNRRWTVGAGASRAVAGGLALGIAVRAFGFADDLADGYFDPELYALLEARIDWSREIGAWRLEASAAPGLQRIEPGDGAITGAFRVGGSLGYELGLGRVASLTLGYSTAGLRRFATSGADYEYLSVGLGLGWAF